MNDTCPFQQLNWCMFRWTLFSLIPSVWNYKLGLCKKSNIKTTKNGPFELWQRVANNKQTNFSGGPFKLNWWNYFRYFLVQRAIYGPATSRKNCVCFRHMHLRFLKLQLLPWKRHLFIRRDSVFVTNSGICVLWLSHDNTFFSFTLFSCLK